MKNKFLIGMGILILIALAGNAYAQTAQAAAGIPQLAFLGNWQWFVMNALVIFALLFMLQAALIPEKLQKERTVSWLFVLIASLVASWLISSSGFVWQHPLVGKLFNYHVLANTIVISLAAYLLLGLLKVNLPSSTAGKTGSWILIALVALMASLKIGNAFVWDIGSVKAFISYLFGPQGILTFNQNRIIVFITSAAIFAWAFQFLKVSPDKPLINYILAVILGANLASGADPVTLAGVVKFGHVVGTLVLGRNLAEQLPSGKWKLAGYVGAFLLLQWAISSASSGQGLMGSWWPGGEEAVPAAPGEAARASGPSALLTLFELFILIGVMIFVYKMAAPALENLFAGGQQQAAQQQAGQQQAAQQQATQQQQGGAP